MISQCLLTLLSTSLDHVLLLVLTPYQHVRSTQIISSYLCTLLSVAAIPTITRVVAYNSTVIGIEWTSPSSNQTVIGYNIYVSGNGAPQDSIRFNGSTNSFNVTNLQPSSNYTITISAVFVDGEEGSVSVSMTVRTLDVSCDPPCPFGGECVATPDTCDCSSITNTGKKVFKCLM